MFVTIVQGQVAQEHWERLRQQYERHTHSIPDGLMETFLVQGHEQPTAWQILTFWQSQEIYEQVRGQKKTTACEMIFLNCDAVPERTCFQVRYGIERFGAP